jgi:hypothetical protein
MARNKAAVYDSRGNNPDWIEFYNSNATAFAMGGMGLSTDPGNPVLWIFPPGVSVPAGGFLIVWCDPSSPVSTNATGNLNAGFSLAGGGAGIYLFNTNQQSVDSVVYGPQIVDQSVGLLSGAWSLLSLPTPGAVNAPAAALGNPANLKINEWMAAPASGNDWFELYNADLLPVSLAGLYFTDDPSIAGATNTLVPPLSFVTGQAWVQYMADNSAAAADHVRFSLNRDGESIRVYSPALSLIDSVEFGSQSTGVSQGRLPDGASAISPFPQSPTPEASNFLPLQNVIVNEVLTHTDPPLEDAIELFNVSSNTVAIGGWFISNSEANFKKYRVPDGTLVPAAGFKVFYEYQFNGSNSAPFTFNSAHGDSAFLSEADASGNLTGYRSQVSFGAAQRGVSFGRVVTSAGVDFVSLASRTFGADNPGTVQQFRTGAGLPNSVPKTGPVLLNELMYHPVTGAGTNLVENTDEEYLELFNMTSNTVPLYDPLAITNHWKIGGGVDYTFPPGVTISPGACALVVGFDPVTNPTALTNFQAKYHPGASVPIYGPWSGHLLNAGDSIQLLQPDTPQVAPHPDAGFVPYVVVENPFYDNGLPWPAAANGTGQSLQRKGLGSYANEPLNWAACSPNPGLRNCYNDTDGDGLPDDWELAHALNPLSALGDDGASGDPDHDGASNIQEFLAGTDPRNASSVFRITSVTRIPAGAAVQFPCVAGRVYTLQVVSTLPGGSWQKVVDVGPFATNTIATVNDVFNASQTPRFYRLLTPLSP